MNTFSKKPLSILLLSAALLVTILPTHATARKKHCKKDACPIPLYLRNGCNEISRPGHYQVKNSMRLDQGDVALKISADNVHIDLCKNVLEGRGNDKELGFTTGIKFIPGLKNVSVRNGTVQKFSLVGLEASNVEKILIEDFCALENGNDNSDLQSPRFPGVSTIEQSAGIAIYGTSETEEIAGVASRAITLRRVLVDSNIGRGIFFAHCTNVVGTDIDALRTQAIASDFLDLGVFLIPGSLGCSISAGPSAFPLSENFLFQNCRFNNSVANPIEAPPGFQLVIPVSIGCQAFWSSLFAGDTTRAFKGLTFIDCDFSNNLATGDTAYEAEGCSITSAENIAYFRCIGNNNRAESTIPGIGVAVGWSMYHCEGLLWQDCVADDNLGGGEYAAGMRVRSCQDVRFERTTANNNRSLIGPSYGWETAEFGQGNPVLSTLTRYQWVDCTANNNRSDDDTLEQVGWQLAGIDGALLENCQGSNNGVAGVSVIPNTEEGTQARNIIVQDSKFVNNGCFGISDISGANTNVYQGNIGLANGGLNFNLGAGFSLDNISLAQGLDPDCLNEPAALAGKRHEPKYILNLAWIEKYMKNSSDSDTN